MNVEQVCRTCLSLSGPFLSIFESNVDSNGGCIAEMLKEFASNNPIRSDNLPGKVCLACISEINHCYNFKLKCENSLRTLCQLLPNATPLKVLANSKKVDTRNQSMQTDEFIQPCTHSMGVQTEQLQNIESVTLPIKFDLSSRSSPSRPTKKAKRSRDNYVPQHMIVKTKREHDQQEEEYVIELQDDEDDEDDNFEDETAAEILSSSSPQPTALNLVSHDHNISYFEITDAQDSFEISKKPIKVQAQDSNASITIGTEEQSFLAAAEKLHYGEEAKDFQLQQVDDINVSDMEHSNVTLRHAPQFGKMHYECSECSMSFISTSTLRRHLFKRHDINSYVLNVSLEEMQEEEEKEQHRQQQQQEKKLVIENVHMTRAYKKTVELVQQKQQKQQQQLQKKEQESITETNEAATDIADEKPEQKYLSNFKYFCNICNAGFAEARSLNYHRKVRSCITPSFKCSECDKVFNTEQNLNEHKVTHSLGHACNECHEVCKSADSLTNHMVKVHNRNLRNQCNICKKVFTMLSALKDHMRVHSGEKPFECDLCDKKFSQKANLKQHILRHSRNKQFKCDDCDSSYVTKAELFSHRRMHTGEHPFSCDMCECSFTTGSSLAKHKRKHTGERPYACEMCPMRFASLNVLKNHRRTHTGEKPYQCNYCQKSFTQKGDCIIHERTHTGERRYHCECGSNFTHLATLRQHLKSHQLRGDKIGWSTATPLRVTIMDTDSKTKGLCKAEEENYLNVSIVTES